MSNDIPWIDDYDDSEEGITDCCPACGEQYDEIDFEYQICSVCGFKNVPDKEIDFDEESEDNNPNDSRNL